MASRRSRRVYKQIGVFLPVERYSDDLAIDPLQRVLNEGQEPADNTMDAGVLYVKGVSLGTAGKFRPWDGIRFAAMRSLFIVQSASTGELFFNKIIERPYDPTLTSQPPLELRCSTYRQKINDSSIDRPANRNVGALRKGILPDVPYFNKLRFWQELDHGNRDNHNVTVFSLYFDFCNGGSLEDLINKYEGLSKAIPEHFIWLVAEQLFLAIVAMKFGRYTVQDDNGRETTVQMPNWTKIYHRDLHPNNVFLNYIPKGPGRIPRVGLANNAFPEIVVGDFGNSGLDGDGPALLPQAVYQPSDDRNQDNGGILFEWEDIYSTGEMLRRMTMTHSATGRPSGLNMRPDSLRVDAVNQEASAPPYSADLINMLRRFEWPNMGNLSVRDIGNDAAINSSFPSPLMVRNTLLPLAQRKVLGYLDPAGKAAGYFDTIDVSWTRPEELMPFSYIMRYATDAGELPDGRPPPDDDSSSSSGTGSRRGSGSGDGDVQMPDSPSAPGSAHDGNSQPDDGSQQQGSQAGSGGDDGGSSSSLSASPSPPPIPRDQQAMRDLNKLHKWNTAKPRYQLRTLEFGVPTILPLKYPPP